MRARLEEEHVRILARHVEDRRIVALAQLQRARGVDKRPPAPAHEDMASDGDNLDVGHGRELRQRALSCHAGAMKSSAPHVMAPPLANREIPMRFTPYLYFKGD